MIRVYYTTTTCPLCRACKRFRSLDDAIYWVENVGNILDYYIQ